MVWKDTFEFLYVVYYMMGDTHIAEETHIPEDLITISYYGCTCTSFSSFVCIVSLSRFQKLTFAYNLYPLTQVHI
jgi:hypothetical protein